MTNHFLKRGATLRRLHDGPLGPYMDAFTDLLLERGHPRNSAQPQLRLVSHLSRWMERRRITLTGLRRPALRRFLEHVRRFRPCGHIHRGEHGPLNTFFELLLKKGVVQEDAPVISNPHHELEQAFAHYLTQERGLALGTQANYLFVTHRFLSTLSRPAKSSLVCLRAGDITKFVLHEARLHSRGRAKVITTCLRGFLRFLYVRGQIANNLALCVPAVAHWRMTTVPKFIEPDQIKRLLKSCDQRTLAGQRDHSILLLLVRLGLRACEVAAMTLEDIDWDAGELVIRGKGLRQARLPLPHDVGKALAAYLCRRPRCAERQVFICIQAPRRGLGFQSVSSIAARALTRAGLHPHSKGSHVLRHSMATNMLRHGASLAEIGDILRHQHPDTTQIYAKVDFVSLRALVQPWPGGFR